MSIKHDDPGVLYASDSLVALVQEMALRGYDTDAIVRAVEKPWKWESESAHLRKLPHDQSGCEFCKQDELEE